MKKRVLSILIAIACLGTVMSSLISCADSPGSTGGADTAGTAQTGDVTTVEPSETQAADPTETATEATTEAVTESNTLSLNMDFFNEYGMTYAELEEKHGKLTDFQTFTGGSWYLFENGYSYYWFGTGVNMNNYITDPEKGFKYIPIDDTKRICRGIWRISPTMLFNEEFETLPIKEIASIEGIHFINTAEDIIVSGKAYASTFTYDGWNNDKVILYIYHDDKNSIDQTSEASFFIHPQDIRAEETQ